MKTTLILPTEPPPPSLKFPLLARSKNCGMVVLFNDFCSGTVVVQGNSSERIGNFSRGWIHVTGNLNFWEILPNGTKLVLEQEL